MIILALGALLMLAAWYCLGRAIGAWLGVFDDDWK